MKTLRRYNFKNHDYFITVVTYNRQSILTKDIDIFLKSWKDIVIHTWVIMPDDLHLIVNSGSNSISDIIHKFKITYSRLYRNKYGPGRVWHKRF